MDKQTIMLALFVALGAVVVTGSITAQGSLLVSFASQDKQYCFEGFDGDDNMGEDCSDTKKE